MTWDRCVINAARSTPPTEFVFHRLNWETVPGGDEVADIEHGSEYVAAEPPGAVAAVWHPDGHEAAREWIGAHLQELGEAGFGPAETQQWQDEPPWST